MYYKYYTSMQCIQATISFFVILSSAHLFEVQPPHDPVSPAVGRSYYPKREGSYTSMLLTEHLFITAAVKITLLTFLVNFDHYFLVCYVAAKISVNVIILRYLCTLSVCKIFLRRRSFL